MAKEIAGNIPMSRKWRWDLVGCDEMCIFAANKSILTV
jgi:hypothetical protein